MNSFARESRRGRAVPESFARARALVVLVGAAGCLTYAHPASADSCAEPLADVFPLPNADSTVPANTRIWLPSDTFAEPPEYHLWGPGDIEVAFDLERITIDHGSLDVLTPAALLTVGGTYEAGVCYLPAENCWTVTTFTVAEGADEALPRVPNAVLLGPYSSEGDARGVLFGVFSTPSDEVVIFDVDGSGGAGPLAADFMGAWHDPGEAVFVGESRCVVSLAEDTGHVRFGGLDLAGNFSGWSEPTFVEKPSERRGAAPNGCAATKGPRGIHELLPAALVVLAAWRRRRCAA